MLQSDVLQLINNRTPLVLWLSHEPLDPRQKYFHEIDYVTDGLLTQSFEQQKTKLIDRDRELLSVPQFQYRLMVYFRKYSPLVSSDEIEKDLIPTLENFQVFSPTHFQGDSIEINVVILNHLQIGIPHHTINALKSSLKTMIQKQSSYTGDLILNLREI